MLSLPFLRARPPSGGLTTWCKEAALAGYASAQNNLAGMYAEGDGVDQNYKKAKEWWERAARQGIAEASGNLANLYENGDGVKRNRKKARKW